MLTSLRSKFKYAEIIEFCIIFLFILFVSINEFGNAKVQPYPYTTAQIVGNILFDCTIFLICYLLLHFYVAPQFEQAANKVQKSTNFVFVLIIIFCLINFINFHFALLLAIKIILIWVNKNRSNVSNALSYEAAILTASWLLLLIIGYNTFLNPRSFFVFEYVVFVVPTSMLVYLYAMYNILPKAIYKKNKRIFYFLRMVPVALTSSLGIFIIMLLFMLHGDVVIFDYHIPVIDEETLVLSGLSLLTQLIIITPVAWNVYRNRYEKNNEVAELKANLGQSNANLDFLKSQINPHFLFNALNTLYGTALQENAERTSEGIQKLGDMMRFMLHENVKDQILLAKDIDYLNNYILIQKLRISNSSGVEITTLIDSPEQKLVIVPMLLIPFVENAFKHGISLINPSYIKITLHVSGNVLYFDIHNTIHVNKANDPEHGHSGIGLENVKQRLQLLYPHKHELIIHQNATEFFVHLTLELEEENL
jgi:two-component system LytT family sensor kinase